MAHNPLPEVIATNLQAIKNWRCRRPGNEANHGVLHECYIHAMFAAAALSVPMAVVMSSVLEAVLAC